MSPAKNYVPVGGELSEVIASLLKGKQPTPSPKEVSAEILKLHPNWKVPERRVKKFIKRHINRHSDPSGADDDTVTSAPKNVSSPRKLLKKVLGFASPRKVPKSEINIVHEAAPETAPVPAPKEEEKPVEKEPEPEMEPSVEIADVEMESKERETAAYEDDNTGKKNDCECTACAVM